MASDTHPLLFVLVSFEGPDAYSQAGGLGVRVSGLAEALAESGYPTSLFFMGDPALPDRERRCHGRLTLYRWGQWISENCPGGVYDGEAARIADLEASLPPYLIDRVLVPAILRGRLPVVLFEEWQTAECACRVSDLLTQAGLRERVRLVWNANNVYGFERIDWRRLDAAATVTTISGAMRAIVRSCGADARVLPNGLPLRAFEPAASIDVDRLQPIVTAREDVGILFKMARWEREKGWAPALDAIRIARNGRARRPILIARAGGPSGGGSGLVEDAESRGLSVVTFDTEASFFATALDAIRADIDVLALRFGVSPELGRALYLLSDGVLANSVFEPFGLVGLEAMAAGGIVFTGGTGEDYANAGRNAIVLESLDPCEIVARWDELVTNPELGQRLRRAARRTAREFAWPVVAERLIHFLVGSETDTPLPAAACNGPRRRTHLARRRPRTAALA